MRRSKRLGRKLFWPWIIIGIILSFISTILHFTEPNSFMDILLDKLMGYVVAPLIIAIVIIGLGFMDEYDRDLDKK